MEDGRSTQAPPRYKGVRMRKWGSWVAEVRYPHSRERLWLGSYPTAEQAARAFDAALYCLRGPGAAFNFPDRPPCIPAADKMSKEEIRAAASRYAWEGVGLAQQSREAEGAGEKTAEVETEEEMMAAVPAAAEETAAEEGSSSSAKVGGGGGGEEWWNEEEDGEGWDECDDIYSSSPLWNF